MHYRLTHPDQGILCPAPAIYASQPTTLPSAFSIMSSQDPTWHIDTSASSHLNFNASNLSTIFGKRLFPSVHVGDGKSILVTNTGHSIIPSQHRPLHLHNVLVQDVLYPPIAKLSILLIGFFSRQVLTPWHHRLGPSGVDQVLRYATRAGFYHSRCDTSLFIYRQGSQVSNLLIYVDDIILTSSCLALLQQIIGSLNNEFDMTDLGALNYFLGISADRTPPGLFLSQKKYALQLFEHAHMVTYNPSQTPVDTKSKLGPKGVSFQDP
ncbi:ribonuclease H-like domain-containing protein [Tanacetum coccineum]